MSRPQPSRWAEDDAGPKRAPVPSAWAEGQLKAWALQPVPAIRPKVMLGHAIVVFDSGRSGGAGPLSPMAEAVAHLVGLSSSLMEDWYQNRRPACHKDKYSTSVVEPKYQRAIIYIANRTSLNE